MIGPYLHATSALYWARFGEWPVSLRLVLRGAAVPVELTEEAKRLALLERARETAT